MIKSNSHRFFQETNDTGDTLAREDNHLNVFDIDFFHFSARIQQRRVEGEGCRASLKLLKEECFAVIQSAFM